MANDYLLVTLFTCFLHRLISNIIALLFRTLLKDIKRQNYNENCVALYSFIRTRSISDKQRSNLMGPGADLSPPECFCYADETNRSQLITISPARIN